MKQIPLIIDTDAGDDIDDVLAIAFAAFRPEIDLLAVTTVTADSGRRAALVREVLDAFRPDLFRTERIGVGVDCGRSLADGWTIRDNGAPRTVEGTTDMDADAA